jgi:hypothetical protein
VAPDASSSCWAVPLTSRGPDAAASYLLRIGGHLDQHWRTWFDGFTLTHEDDGTSTLRGAVRDHQSELHGLLVRVRDLGTTLISVTPTPGGPDQ